MRPVARFSLLLLAVLPVVAACLPQQQEASNLDGPQAFANHAAGDVRAAALFGEAAKVIMHPRCVNCHPAGDSPKQGDDRRIHRPAVTRGAGNLGVPGMQCNACHQARNFDPGRIPGAPHWSLAPQEAAWEGLDASAICEQLKDPQRNGGRSLEDIVTHMREDALVAWAWRPGRGRQSAPGTQEVFGALIEAWVAEGAACP